MQVPPPPPLGLSWAVMGGKQHLIPPLAMDGNTTAPWGLRAVPQPRVSAGMGNHHLSGHPVPVLVLGIALKPAWLLVSL